MADSAAPMRAPGQKARDLLSAWREAERRRDRLSPDADSFRQAGVDTVNAWLAYQHEIAPSHPDEVTVVADDERRYVAVSSNMVGLLGYQPSELMGRLVDELAAPGVVDATPALWQEFISAGRGTSSFELVARDGSLVGVAYDAVADFPVPGFHVSRLRRLNAPGGGPGAIGAAHSAPATDEPSTEPLEELASRWLAAEIRAAELPRSGVLSVKATRLGEAYELALRCASQEDLLLAWESARKRQAGIDIGSAEWAEARRVSELLRTEYAARQDRPERRQNDGRA